MSGIKQADVARVAALYVYGGVYADIDVEAVQSLDDLLDAAAESRAGVLLGEENIVHTVLLERRFSARLVSNAVMASSPRHPFWLEVLDEIFETSSRCGNDPVLCTGPRLIDRLSLRHIRENRECVASGCLIRLPFQYFSSHIAMWNVGSMARGCRDMLSKVRFFKADEAEVAQSACRMFEDTLHNPSVLQTNRTFAVHHWQCSWCRKDDTMHVTIPLMELVWRVGNETLWSGTHGISESTKHNQNEMLTGLRPVVPHTEDATQKIGLVEQGIVYYPP